MPKNKITEEKVEKVTKALKKLKTSKPVANKVKKPTPDPNPVVAYCDCDLALNWGSVTIEPGPVKKLDWDSIPKKIRDFWINCRALRKL